MCAKILLNKKRKKKKEYDDVSRRASMTGEKDFFGGIAHVALFMQGSLNMGKISIYI